jgi:hypothetical protein
MEETSDKRSITKGFLEKCLGVAVESFKVSAGSDPGDNFMSVMHCVEVLVAGEERPRHLILKSYPSHPSRREFLDNINIFSKEVKVYQVFIPAILEMAGQVDAATLHKPHELPFPTLVAGKAVDHSVEVAVAGTPLSQSFFSRSPN